MARIRLMRIVSLRFFHLGILILILLPLSFSLLFCFDSSLSLINRRIVYCSLLFDRELQEYVKGI